MILVDKAKRALDRAQSESDSIQRSLWLAKAADYAIKDRAVMVGGAAVNLHTGSYRPTDIDMCAYLNQSDRQAMVQLGFDNTQGDHFSFEFEDGQIWLVEFPASQVDGDVSSIQLSRDDSLDVISLESLIVDRTLQATDGTGVTFDEAVRLCVAAYEAANWAWIGEEIERRSTIEPGLGLQDAYSRIMLRTRSLLATLG